MCWLNLSSALLAIAAAVLWWLSATIKLPYKFPLQVLSVHSMA
ncbi:hypothetical protein ABIB87_009022 [Bradyrhizobium sp. JR18.2]